MLAYITDRSRTLSSKVANRLYSMFVPSYVSDQEKEAKSSGHYYWDEKSRIIKVVQKEEVANPAQDSDHLKTLHVEDNAEIRSIVGYYLRKKFDIQFAKSGSSAVEAVDKEKYDVIIMDINLGEGIDGIEAAKQIRNKQGYENVPIIAVTANLSADIRENCIEAGMDAFLPKPFQRDDLINTIDFVLQKKGLRINAAC